MRNSIQIDPWTYFFAALLTLTVPLDWLFSALCAAVIHELCHVGMIMLLGGRVVRIRVCIGGAVIDSEIPGKREELLCALAGPAGSIILLLLCNIFPKLAICSFVQGIFNLLPVYPLDGGRAIRCGLELICPARSEKILHWVEVGLYIAIPLLAAAMTFLFSIGFLPIFTAITLISKAILRKRPCKQRQMRVQ